MMAPGPFPTGAEPTEGRLHLPSLLVGLVIMVGGTVYPLIMADSSGRADHLFASSLLWAMSAGFIHGVGFAPRALLWRWLFSGWACAVALGCALVVKWLP